MRCPVCVEEGTASRVFEDGTRSTLMYCEPWYDEEGIYHHHDSNTLTTGLSCSNGHRFTRRGHAGCGAPGCGFVENWEITVNA